MQRSTVEYWEGNTDYIRRNSDEHFNGIHARRQMFEEALSRTEPIFSVIEFGANVGLNLVALRSILPMAALTGVEINKDACIELGMNADAMLNGSMLDYRGPSHDLAITRGVMIHIPPHDLQAAYDVLYSSANRYILIAEYYSPSPVEIEYRGQKGLLWKRDFAGEMLERFKNLRLVNYGFAYRHDPKYPQDDVSWFLLEKQL